jgi:3-hydroxyisobutyrate dehydrogenase-like beta-hydroxyacid dehydrogenase
MKTTGVVLTKPKECKLRVGQIGLGKAGQHFATHLMKSCTHLRVYDSDPSRVQKLVALGAIGATTIEPIGANCEAVLLSLPAPPAVRTVLLGDRGLFALLKPGSLVIDCSTIDPDTCREVNAAARAHGIGYLEAPVSGGDPLQAGVDGAQAGTMTFMVGGDRDVFDMALPIFGMIGKYAHYLGPAGSGATVKLISNHMAGLHNLVCAEAFILGAAAGFSYETLLEVFDRTDAKSYFMSDYIAPRLNRRDFSAGFAVDLMYKDHRLAEELARKLKVPMLFNQLALEVYQMLRARGDGHKDMVEAFNLLGNLAQVDVFQPRSPEAVPA